MRATIRTIQTWVIALILVGALLLVLLRRIHDEESMMQDEFGQEWDAYTQKTWRLIPFVY